MPVINFSQACHQHGSFPVHRKTGDRNLLSSIWTLFPHAFPEYKDLTMLSVVLIFKNTAARRGKWEGLGEGSLGEGTTAVGSWQRLA